MKKRFISLYANEEEQKNFELIKKDMRRKSDSDTLRALIGEKAEKILSKNVAITNAFKKREG